VSVKWASLIVAVIALVQVWVIALWRRFFRRGSLDIHETGLIEVGFSQFGPTIALLGTLRAINHDQFVRRMRLVITRRRDGARHSFDWESFRGGASSGQIGFETPASFLVSTAEPQRFNVFFSDTETREEVGTWLQRTSLAWQAKLLEDSEQHAEDPEDDEARLRALYEEFQGEEAHVDTYTELTRITYWNAGQYGLVLQVETSRPERRYERRWEFTLTDEDAESLRLNAISTLRVTCGFAEGARFNFAYARYEDVPEAQ
jgi:hypothetical protein